MLAQFNGIGNSQWGVSASSWRQIYTGMIRAVALWGAELGWRGQKDWEEEMEKLQYQCLKKCVNATHGSRRELVSQIAGVESPRMALDAAQARVMAKMMGDQTAMEGIWGVAEEGRQWDDFDEPYPNKDGFTSVFTRIQSTAGILMEEGNERLQCGGRVVLVKVEEVTL